MRPDHESDLRPAFGELQRRSREQAPAFDPMRRHALRQAAASKESASARELWPRWAGLVGAAAAMLVVAAGVWWSRPVAPPAPQLVAAMASVDRVDQLLEVIEHGLGADEIPSHPLYATDVLLTQNTIETAL